MRHPFGDLVKRHLQRQPGLSQFKLANRIDIDPAVLSAMCQGRRLTGPDTRSRVLAIIQGLHGEGVLTLPTEADALLNAAGLVGLQKSDPIDLGLCGETETPVLPGPDAANSTARGFPPPFLTPTLPPQGVLGRTAPFTEIFELLVLQDSAIANVAPVVLRGMGGIGKTTLAIAIGRDPRLLTTFPDGVLWTALGPTPTIRPLLDNWGRALGVELGAEPDEAACRARLQSLIRERRLLLIIDDVWDATAADYFMVGGPYCRTLITTRESPIAYELTTPARTLAVDLLTPAAALELLQRLAPAAVEYDKENAQRVCRRLDYLPLALTLAGHTLALEGLVPGRLQRLLTDLLERRATRLKLLEHRGRLGIDQTEVSLQAILGLSVDRLQETDRVYFALLSAFGAEPLTWEIHAVAAVWQCAPNEAELITARLMQRGLVEERNGRYWMHALLADYAAELCEGRPW